MHVEIHFSALKTATAKVLVVGVWQGSTIAAAPRAMGLEAVVSRAMAATCGFTGKTGQTLTITAPADVKADTVIVAGLGPYGEMTTDTARRIGAEAGAAIAITGATSAVVALEFSPLQAAWFALGLRLRTHRTPRHRGRPDPDILPPVDHVTIRLADPGRAEAAWTSLKAIADGVELARDLTTQPANILTPASFAGHARALEPLGVQVEILDERALAAANMNLHLAVGAASDHPPRLAVLRWRGAAVDQAPVLLVGKGLTFDTGGLCIKPAAGMDDMKGDMGGAATVIGTLRAVAQARLPVNVTGLLVLAENMVGGAAYRPGDVITGHAGLSVEVIDTDAEGRMVLADALSWGCATEAPSAVIDLATLTGSIVAALGAHTAGLFARAEPSSDDLANALTAAGKTCGEALWRMPLTDFHDDDLKSEIADLRQCAPAGSGMWGGRLLPDALHAARFLSHFVPPSVPWVHLDIAGVAESAETRDLYTKGATGFGVLTLATWLGGLPGNT